MSSLLEAVESKDTLSIRKYLKSYITVDPADGNGTIKKALQEIASKSLNVWEEHDGGELKQSRQDWNENYFVDLQVDLRMNFSKERYMHMLEVGKVVFPAPVSQPKPAPSQTTGHWTKTITTGTGKTEKKNRTLIWAGIAVVVLGVIVIKLIKNG